jgi:hypothetical protein
VMSPATRLYHVDSVLRKTMNLLREAFYDLVERSLFFDASRTW